MEAHRTTTGALTPAEERAASSPVAWDVLAAVNIVLGIWLIASPYLLNFSPYYSATVNNDIFGTAVMLMAITRLAVPWQYRWVSAGNVIFGIWVIISPFVLHLTGSGLGTVNNIVVGVLIALISATGFVRQPLA